MQHKEKTLKKGLLKEKFGEGIAFLALLAVVGGLTKCSEDILHPASHTKKWLEDQGYTEIIKVETGQHTCEKHEIAQRFQFKIQDGYTTERTVCVNTLGAESFRLDQH